MNGLSIYFHSYIWSIKKHSGAQENKYILDMDAKSKWLHDVLKNDSKNKLVKAKPLKVGDFYKIHDKKYVDHIFSGSPEEVKKYSWITWSNGFVRSQLYTSGIVFDAITNAYKNKTIVGCLAVEGHHAKKDHGSGFCTFNHLIVALNKFVTNKSVKSLIIDLDLHLGDGTLELIKNNKSIRVFDIYGLIHNNNGKPINLGSQMLNKALNKEVYFRYLDKLEGYIKHTNPNLILYIAGVDPFVGDRYGGISGLNIESLKKRDEIVFKLSKKYQIPTVFTLGGGYVKYPDLNGNKRKTLVTLHKNTFIAAGKNNKFKCSRYSQ